MALYLNILTVLLLALVAGLLLMLHTQLRAWREASREAPLLAEKLTEAILSARKGLSDLKQDLNNLAPDLNRLTDEGGKLRVELQFLMQRGAQVAEQLDVRRPVVINRAATVQEEDEADSMPTVRLAPTVQAMVEEVAGANGLAAKPMASPLVHAGRMQGADPLEELLAGLQAHGDAEPLRRSPNKRKRVGPVTQAELDLQQSLGMSESDF